MENKELLNQIQGEVKDIELLINAFAGKDSIPLIELDICLDKMKKLYQDINKLKNTERDFMPPEHNKDEYIDSFDVNDSIGDDDEDETHNDSEDNNITSGNNEADNVVEEESTDAKPDAVIEKKVVDDFKTEITIEKEKDNKSTKNKYGGGEVVADRIKPKKQSINDMISQNKFDKDISSKFKTSQINDINKAININDRVWFIKELFKGDSALYKRTISELNASADLDSALNFIKNNFDWDSSEKVVEKFVKVLSRRFV